MFVFWISLSSVVCQPDFRVCYVFEGKPSISALLHVQMCHKWVLLSSSVKQCFRSHWSSNDTVIGPEGL